jgi:hypothetical protein
VIFDSKNSIARRILKSFCYLTLRNGVIHTALHALQLYLRFTGLENVSLLCGTRKKRLPRIKPNIMVKRFFTDGPPISHGQLRIQI